MDMQKGRISRKIVIIFSVLVVVILTAIVTLGKREPVGQNEAGVVVNRYGTFRVYSSGSKPFVLPFFQKFYTISMEPVVLSFIDDEGVHIRSEDGQDIVVESQVTYYIGNVERAIGVLGYVSFGEKIRKKIKDHVSELLRERVTEAAFIEDTQQRIIIMAELHLALNDIMNDSGINITGFQLRYE